MAPADLHSFGPLHRRTPSTSWSQWPEQQSAFAVQSSPVTLQELAGTSQVPLTQLSEQHCVFCVHFWWKERHVAQLTPGKQVVPKQQPLAHDVVLHVQLPATHCWPGAHALLTPQVHAPFVQLSARFGSQATHAPPFAPQFCNDGGSHVLPEQQPLVHVCEHPVQALFVHCAPPGHATQPMPPDPHAPGWLPGWQTPLPSQQPFGQAAAVQRQEPPTQAVPAPHAGPPPHVHVPPEQESDVVGSHTKHTPPPVPQVASDCGLHVEPLQQPFGQDAASHVQAPPWHACPVVHAGLPPQVHMPFVHASDCVGSQVMQPLPPIPHAFSDGAVQTLPLQHPLGHEVALH